MASKYKQFTEIMEKDPLTIMCLFCNKEWQPQTDDQGRGVRDSYKCPNNCTAIYDRAEYNLNASLFRKDTQTGKFYAVNGKDIAKIIEQRYGYPKAPPARKTLDSEDGTPGELVFTNIDDTPSGAVITGQSNSEGSEETAKTFEELDTKVF